MKKIALALAFALISFASYAQKVNYSGEWKLNMAESDLGSEFSLAPASMSIKHSRKILDIQLINEWNGDSLVSNQHYILNGKECENPGFAESVTKSTALVLRKSKAIEIVTHGSAEGMDYTFSQTISLKGEQLQVKAEATSDLGELVETFVFDRQ